MREHIYRAWDKKRKRMYKVIDLHLGSSEGVWATVEGFSVRENKEVHIQVQPKDAVIMQWTGLKDNSEIPKLIFEGDIVQVGDKIMEVKFLEGCWRSKWGEFTNYRLYGFQDAGIEVIGNIHSNPELINK